MIDNKIVLRIKGYEQLYAISSEGKVISLNYKRTGIMKEMKPNINNKGYELVKLTKNGVSTPFLVHRLVALHFLEVPPVEKINVNHIDGNPRNNAAQNLEWCTQKENSIHSRDVLGKKPGKPNHGTKNGLAKLTEADILAIRASSESQNTLAAIYGVSNKNIGYIKRRATWKHI